MGFHEDDGENFRTSHFDFEHFATAVSVAKELLTVLGPILKCNTNLEIKNTKNWYTIDALGAIFVILTMLTLGMWTLLTILTLNWSNPTLMAFPI